MNAKETLSGIVQRIQAAGMSSPAVFIFISAAGISQLFYKYISNAIQLNVLFSFSAVWLCNDKIKAASPRAKAVFFCSQIAVLAAVYLTGLFTFSEQLESICFSLIYLYCIGAVIAFFPAADFLKECKLRFVHILVALLFFAAVYCALFIAVLFINAIFNLTIDFSESIIFRITNATAMVTALTVFAAYRSKPLVHSKFFAVMFQKLLPMLLVPIGVLGLVYLTKYVFFPCSTESIAFPLYYLVLSGIVLCLLMMQHFEDRSMLVRLMLVLLGIASLLFIAAMLRERVTNTRHYGRIGFTHDDFLPLHEIAVNGLLALYFFAAAFSGKNITARFRTVAAVITLILFFPIIGFYNYVHFKSGYTVKLRNASEEFSLKRERENGAVPRSEHLYQSYPSVHESSDTADYIIDTTGYSAVLLGVDLRLDAIPAESIPQQAQCRYKQFLFSIEPDGKFLKITDETAGQMILIDFYTRIKADSAASDTASENQPFIYEDQKVKIIIGDASYAEEKYARIAFDAYIKREPLY